MPDLTNKTNWTYHITGRPLEYQDKIYFEASYNGVDNLYVIENEQIFTEATSEEINQAAELAAEAFKSFSKKSGLEKANFLRTIADEIIAMGDDLIAMYQLETGLPEGRAKGERGRTVGQLTSFATMLEEGSWVAATIDTADLERKPIPKQDIRKMLVPLGPVVVFGASNFPFAYSTAGGDTASALAAGCPVICKSHPMHAGTGEMVSDAIIRAAQKTNMPNGVFSNLNSAGIEVGIELVTHPDIKAVGFTGSIQGGRALYDIAAQRDEPIPVFAEMGSINPVVLLPKAIQNRGRLRFLRKRRPTREKYLCHQSTVSVPSAAASIRRALSHCR